MTVRVIKPGFIIAGVVLLALAASLPLLATPLRSNLGVFFPTVVGGALGYFFLSAGSVLVLGERCRVGEFWRHRVVGDDLQALRGEVYSGGASLFAGERRLWSRSVFGPFDSQRSCEIDVAKCRSVLTEALTTEDLE